VGSSPRKSTRSLVAPELQQNLPVDWGANRVQTLRPRCDLSVSVLTIVGSQKDDIGPNGTSSLPTLCAPCHRIHHRLLRQTERRYLTHQAFCGGGMIFFILPHWRALQLSGYSQLALKVSGSIPITCTWDFSVSLSVCPAGYEYSSLLCAGEGDGGTEEEWRATSDIPLLVQVDSLSVTFPKRVLPKG